MSAEPNAGLEVTAATGGFSVGVVAAVVFAVGLADEASEPLGPIDCESADDEADAVGAAVPATVDVDASVPEHPAARPRTRTIKIDNTGRRTAVPSHRKMTYCLMCTQVVAGVVTCRRRNARFTRSGQSAAQAGAYRLLKCSAGVRKTARADPIRVDPDHLDLRRIRIRLRCRTTRRRRSRPAGRDRRTSMPPDPRR